MDYVYKYHKYKQLYNQVQTEEKYKKYKKIYRELKYGGAQSQSVSRCISGTSKGCIIKNNNKYHYPRCGFINNLEQTPNY